MKIYAEKLARHFKDQLLPIYIVSGDDPLLNQEACDQIRAAARNAGCSEREVHHVEGSFDWQTVLMSANSMSLFADRKLIELRIVNGKPGDAGSKALQEYASNASPDNVLLIILPKLDGNQQRSKWFKALDKVAAFVQIWPVENNRLPGWIAQRLNSAGLHADQAAIHLLAERAEGNLLAAIQEIEKLKLLSNDQQITQELINQVVADSARYDVFGLVDKALNGDVKQALKTLAGLRGEGTEAVVILWALTRQIRTLLQVTLALESGQASDWAMKSAGVWDKHKNQTQQALRRLNRTTLEQLLKDAWLADQAAKGMRKNVSVWDELSHLTLSLSGQALGHL